MTKIDPKTDLVLTRVVEVAPERVWAAWTQPELVKKWFAPRPWTTTECEIDLRPGGVFRTRMAGPAGETSETVAAWLEIVPDRKLVWTIALGPAFRPSRHPAVPSFTAIVTIEPHPRGTKYVTVVMHEDEAGARKHEEMGFHQGWGAALDQLVELAKG